MVTTILFEAIIWQHSTAMRVKAFELAFFALVLCACGSAETLDNNAGADATPSALATASVLKVTGGAGESHATPTQRHPTPGLSVQFTSLAAVKPGSYATATIKTVASAQCSIDVEYKSGPSTAAGLDPKAADAAGAVTWRWRVGSKTTPGDWPVTVTCTKGEATAKETKNLTVE